MKIVRFYICTLCFFRRSMTFKASVTFHGSIIFLAIEIHGGADRCDIDQTEVDNGKSHMLE